MDIELLKTILENLDLELGEEFKVDNDDKYKYKFKKDGLYTRSVNDNQWYKDLDVTLNYFLDNEIIKIPDIKLNEEQKNVLKNLDKKHKWIARDFELLYNYGDNKGLLCIFVNKPEMENKEWRATIGTLMNFSMFDELFSNIKDGKCYNIKELLEGND